jgi:hypothetical protein
MRLPNWEHLFVDFIRAKSTAEFAWGTNDCCTFSADNWLCLTGADPLQSLRGRWYDETSAEEVLASEGGLEVAIHRLLGEPMEHPMCIQRGDVALCSGQQLIVAVCIGEFVVAPSRVGLFRANLDRVIAAWPVGGPRG